MKTRRKKHLILGLGDVMIDAYFFTPDSRHPRTDTVGRVELAAGGSAANFAVWVARHSHASGLIGRVGDDFLGHALVEELESEGVQPFIVFDTECGTGRVGVIVSEDGERDMICDRRANTRLSPDDIPCEAIRKARWLHISGYAFFEPGPAGAARRAMETALAAGVPISVDPAAYSFINAVGRGDFLRLCSGATVILPNLDEGRAMTGLSRPLDIAKSLAEDFPVVALKLGAAGCIGLSQNEPEPIRLPPVPAEVVDTTGAGDAFGAGFVMACSRGAGLAESLARGNQLGAAAVSRVGAQSL
ncbi:MAG: sugar kinase [Firmicutes bacterium]|nr:sugar kinase [Bacillota bacterium]